MNNPMTNPIHGNAEDTEAEDAEVKFRKNSIFERANTLGENVFERANTFGGQINRTLTGALNIIDPDSVFTNKLIEDFNKHDEERKYQGDIPLQTGFSRKSLFWKYACVSGLISAFTAVVAIAFMNFNEEIPKRWVNCDFDEKVSCGDIGSGKLRYIFIPMCTGILVGVIRFAVDYPKDIPGLFKEITEMHVNYRWAPASLLLSAVSLAGGGSLGPEHALSNMGGGTT